MNPRSFPQCISLPAASLIFILLSSCSQTEHKSVEEKPPQSIAPPTPTLPPRVTRKDELYIFLDSLERRYESACIGIGLATWNSYSKEALSNLDSATRTLAHIFSDTTTRAIIEEWRKKSSSLADKPLARRLELWHRCFMGGSVFADPEISRLEDSLRHLISNFTFSFNGTPITRSKLATMLRDEKRQSRRHALWTAQSQLSSLIEHDLIRLVELRNERARTLGFPNFYSLVLYLQSIDEEWLLRMIAALDEETRSEFDDFVTAAAKKLRVNELGPWDFDYALREAITIPDRYFPPDSAFSVVHRFESGIGFDVDTLPIKEIVRDDPNGGISLAIEIPNDSRFIVNPMKGMGFYAAVFRSYGQSLHHVLTRVDYPILRGYEWIPGAWSPAYSEGVAEMHAEFLDDSLWLTALTKARSKQLDRYLNGPHLPELYRLRRLLKDFTVEYEVYKDPDQDMAAVERAAFKKYLLVDLDSTEMPSQCIGIASIGFRSEPCSSQDELLARMIATQLQEAFSSKFGDEKCMNPKLAGWIVEHLYASGEREEWTERIRNATGKALEPGAYLRKIGIVPMKAITNE